MSSYTLITGASSGLGLALAEALARRGEALILVARERPALESIACELSQRFAIEVMFRVCDLTEPLQLSGLLLEIEQCGYRIERLINNAGSACAGEFLAHEWRRERQLLELNILALTRLCHALGAQMAARGHGEILNVASLAAFQPGPWLSSYYASKAFVLHFSEGLHSELAGYGVHVATLCPGPVRTSFWHNAQLDIRHLQGSAWLMNAEQIAQQALAGLARRQSVIIPGWRNRLASLLVRLLPRALVRRLAGQLNRRLLSR
ncbi:SDR family oxidoreductase [Pseudomonas sp. NW5]|uniref:SDR family NAD(P)-dependent oxidoreductase n=1 Tax=Pseudomonas sp. NW5 TaxID=2934934 RepID=UPI0020220C5E|nr:SDR family oxidoreductase [Pseudomonas sp. NW5]MCL7463056.1 SDR family oxidoreductase [Pseudomonas sp. NW5]